MYSRIKQLNRFTDMIQIRPSQLSDLDRLMEIFDHARKFMASVGNGNQWINGYPQRELIASDGSYKGIGDICLNWCTKQYSSLRADTHKDNIIMQNLLARNEFIRCGTVYVSNGTPRIAYQKISR